MSQSKKDGKPSFENLGISPKILEQLQSLGFVEPTPIQHKSIPIAIKGEDVVGIAQTGTGKTLAFSIPMIQILGEKKGKGLILAPTRELALQIEESLRKVGNALGLRTAVLIGGASMNPQLDQLRRKPHVVIATPGRLIDHLEQKTLTLADVKIFVLDEADRMLDMGFMPQIKKVIAQIPKERQTMLFSATMPAKITEIARSYMKKPVRVEVAPQGTAADNVEQQVYLVETRDKTRLLDKLLKETKGTVLVFTRTKYRAKKVTLALRRLNYTAAEIHSNRSLKQRKDSLAGFKSGKFRVLVATDIASRGIDVIGIELVINYDLPDQNEDYVHRIGRTGRAGRDGLAVSFVAPDQKRQVLAIEKLVRVRLDLQPLPELPEHKDLQTFERRDFTASRHRSESERYRRSGGRSSGRRSSGYKGSNPRGSSSGGRSSGYKGSNPRGSSTGGYKGKASNFNDGPRKKTRRSTNNKRRGAAGASRSTDAGYSDPFLSDTRRGQTKYTEGRTSSRGRKPSGGRGRPTSGRKPSTRSKSSSSSRSKSRSQGKPIYRKNWN